MKKRILCVLLTLALLLAPATHVFAAQSEVAVVIDNQPVPFTSDSGWPFVDANGRTQVPLRIVMEQYGCQVAWNSADNAAVITKGGTTVVVPVGQPYILVNGRTVAMDTAALIQDGRTYLPIRAVLEAFGASAVWDNGTVSVASATAGNGLESAYVDKDGNLIVTLANGSKLNAGTVPSGRDGRDGADGVSVTNAYVDAAGNLMIVLSSGRTINAGSVGAGGGTGGADFGGYPVGTKFYLTQPAGAFSVTVYVDSKPCLVSFDAVYYELSSKYDDSDPAAWLYEDSATTFLPYCVNLFLSGRADASLAGQTIAVSFSDAGYGSWMYETVIDADGTFNLNETLPWRAPKSLYLNRVTIRAGARPPVVDPDEPDPEEIQKLIDACAGDWAAAPDDVVTLKKDGTLTYRGTEYTAEFSIGKYNSLTACITTDEGRIYFDFYVDEGEMYGGRRTTYYRGRTWEQVVLTAENFLDYYELTETATWEFNAFGEFEYVAIDQFVTMKEEYRDRFDEKCSTLTAVKAYVDACGAISSEVDLASRTYSISPLEDDNLGSHRERIWEATSVERPCSMYRYYSMPHLPNGYTAKLNANYVTNFTVLDVIGTLWLINN